MAEPPRPHPGTEQRGSGCDGGAVIPKWGHGAVTGSQHGRMLAGLWVQPSQSPRSQLGEGDGSQLCLSTSPAVPSLNFSHLPLPNIDIFRGFSSVLWSLPTRTGFCPHHLAGMSCVDETGMLLAVRGSSNPQTIPHPPAVTYFPPSASPLVADPSPRHPGGPSPPEGGTSPW